MKLIDRYICREVFSHALVGLAIFTFVFFIPRLLLMMQLVVRHSAATGRLALLFLSAFPPVLKFTLPIAVLVGVLIGLGRMSADSELIALNSVGVGMRRVLVPVGALALTAAALTLAMTLWLGPRAIGYIRTTEDHLEVSQASFQIQPRVFDERFPHLILFVQDSSAAGTHWRGVFLAETGNDKHTELTLAEDAIVVTSRGLDKLDADATLELHLRDGSTHEYSPNNPNQYGVQRFGESDWPVQLGSLEQTHASARSTAEKSLAELIAVSGPGWREAHVEAQQRFAFPGACIVFALLAVPLAARPRRGGRAMGFLMSLLLVCGYYLVLVLGSGFAREGKITPATGAWLADIVTMIAALALLPTMERMPGENWISRIGPWLQTWMRRPRKPILQAKPATAEGAQTASRVRTIPIRQAVRRLSHTSGFPQMMDWYLLRSFVFYFAVLSAGFIFVFEIFTFFELLDDIARHHTSFIIVANYFRYHIPFLFYQLSPLAALVATLVTIGVLTKNNEIVAIKASGMSLYRLALPLVAGSALLGVGLLALDNSFLPYANQRQDELRNIIKAKPPQTYLRPNRNWIFGEKSAANDFDKVYNYEVFDPDGEYFGGLNVFELDPLTFALKRRVHAERATWSAEKGAWTLASGWVRDFDGSQITRYLPFDRFELAELSEPPGYFNREVRQYYQMDWWQLSEYIRELRQAGFDVARLSVQLQKKLAFPVIAPVITLLAIPFALLVGTRGAIGGIALGVGIAIVYWATATLFEALGGVGQLPPIMAGWAPDAIFAFLGTYFFLRMPT